MQQLMAASSPDRADKDVLALRGHFIASLGRNADIVDEALRILVKRKRKAARRLQAAIRGDEHSTRRTETEFVRRLHRVRPEIEPWLMNQFEVLACERDMLHSATSLATLTGEHVLNEHIAPTVTVTESLSTVRELFGKAFEELSGAPAEPGERHGSASLSDIEAELDQLTSHVLHDLYAGDRTTQNTSLMLGIILEMRDLHRELRRAAAW
jgi:hypothetical protein